ncbi:MAG: PQQ-binding-like beta-propeller repeat protein [Bacteroidetes bacterium]|jgi:hypothetical protein|nr:PQQ-binding-like beta-propeller repeat protein [Bacteroidota bacterium]
MKPTRYLLLAYCLAAVLSCTKEDVKPQYEPVLLDTIDLNTKLTDPGGIILHALQPWDEEYLLIHETAVSHYSSLYSYRLSDGKVTPMGEEVYRDLINDANISKRGDEIVLIGRYDGVEILVVGLEDMSVKRRFPLRYPIDPIGGFHHLVGPNLYYKNYSGQNIQINQINIDDGELQVVYNVDRSAERVDGEYTTPLKWEIYESVNQTARLLTVDRLPDGQIGLVHYELAENQLIWQVGLEEFEAAGAVSPKTVLLGENQVYVIADDYISCRSLSDGALIWSNPRTAADANHLVRVFGDKLISVGEELIEAFDTSDGRLVWSLQENYALWLFWNSAQLSMVNYGDYLILNCFPIDIRTGHVLWSERPEMQGLNIYTRNNNIPYVDLNQKVLYYLKDAILYKWELPPID